MIEKLSEKSKGPGSCPLSRILSQLIFEDFIWSTQLDLLLMRHFLVLLKSINIIDGLELLFLPILNKSCFLLLTLFDWKVVFYIES